MFSDFMDGDGDGDLDLTPPVDTLPRHHMRPTLLGANILKSIDHIAVECNPAHLTLGNKITAMCAVLGLSRSTNTSMLTMDGPMMHSTTEHWRRNIAMHLKRCVVVACG